MSAIYRYAGFGNESAYGDPVAAAFHVDIASASLDSPSGTDTEYAGGLSRGVRTVRPGFYRPEGDIVYAWDIRTIAAMLRWTLGGYLFTAPSNKTVTTSAAADDIIDTTTAHGFVAGDVVEFTAITGGAGLVADTPYYVLATNLAAQTFKIAAFPDGPAIDFTTDISAGTVHLVENRHEMFSVNDTELPSFTARIGKDLFEHVFAGCVSDQLELALAEDLLQATMTVGAKVDSKASLTAEASLLLPSEFPLAFHEVTLALPTGVDVSADVRNLSLRIQNGLAADLGRGIGSRFPRRQVAGGRTVMLTCDLYYHSTDHLEAMWGDADGPQEGDGADEYALRIYADAGADGGLQIDVPAARFTQVQTQPSGKDPLVQTCQIGARMSSVQPSSGSAVSSELLAKVVSALPDQEP